MEDSPAGKKTNTNNFVESPKKTTVTNQSQWSFGWQPGTRDVFNRPNNSKGTHPPIQASTPTITSPASTSVSKKEVGPMKNQSEMARRKNPPKIDPSGTTTPRLQARPQWCWEPRRPTTARRTRCTRKEPPPPSPRVVKNDQTIRHAL